MEQSPTLHVNDIDALRQLCWTRALEAYGTAYIFERRARRLKLWLRLLTFIGFLPALVVGAFVLSSFGLVGVVVVSATIIAILQFVASFWALVAQWVDTYGYSVESMSANNSLSDRYGNLARTPPDELALMRALFESIETEDQSRRNLDYRQSLTDKEKRRGMRAALRQYRRSCAHCNQIPASMTATDCGVCGNF